MQNAVREVDKVNFSLLVFANVDDANLRVGELTREKLPKLVTLEFSKAKRRGIYIDYLQNTRAKSTAGPYSVRPKARAPVSAPLRWDEIAALGRPGEPSEIADLIFFLASDAAQWITGETVSIDGGRHLTCAR